MDTADLRIFSYLPNPRVWKALIAAEYCGVSVEVKGDSPPALTTWLWDFDARPLPEEERTASSPHARVSQRGFSGTLYKTDAFLEAHPFGTVPALELDDGSYLKESLAIIAYLEDKFPDGALIAGTPEEKAHARDLERIVDLRICGPMGGYGHAVNSPLGYPPDPEKAEQLLKSMQKPLDYVEESLGDDRPLLMGDKVSIADCTLQASLQFMRFIETDVFGDRPRLRAWDERYRKRPAAKAVLKW